MVSFGRSSMPTGSRLQFSASSYGSNNNKWGSGRGNAGRGSRGGRQRGGWNGGMGRKQKHDQSYPSQLSKTLASVIRYQRKVSSHY